MRLFVSEPVLKLMSPLAGVQPKVSVNGAEVALSDEPSEFCGTPQLVAKGATILGRYRAFGDSLLWTRRPASDLHRGEGHIDVSPAQECCHSAPGD